MSKQIFPKVLAIGAVMFLAACGTVHPPAPDDTRGPKPTELRKHVMEVLEPDSIFIRDWYSRIGDIDAQTEMVMSEIIEGHTYLKGGFTAYTFKTWQYCVSLINPPKEAGGRVRVGVMTIAVKNSKGNLGSNNCLWYDPTPEFEKGVAEAKARVSR